MLTAVVHRHLGYLPMIIHRYFARNPALRRLIDGLGFVPGDGGELTRAVERGEHVIVRTGRDPGGLPQLPPPLPGGLGGRLGYCAWPCVTACPSSRWPPPASTTSTWA